jgi:hypothetical protein
MANKWDQYKDSIINLCLHKTLAEMKRSLGDMYFYVTLHKTLAEIKELLGEKGFHVT